MNLGGGAFLRGAERAEVRRCCASRQVNRFDVFDSTIVGIRNCTASHNTGWGVHLFNTTHSTIEGNMLDHNIRQGDGDSAAVLLVYGSH